jgi:signal transduction histidine kinase
MSIINTEAARPFKEYFDHWTAQPDVVLLDDGRQLNPDLVSVQFPSELSKRNPPYGWMDLHFVITPQGLLDSPQIPDSRGGWPAEDADFDPEFALRARQTWAWLERLYPSLDLRARIADAFHREEPVDTVPGPLEPIAARPTGVARVARLGFLRRGVGASQQRYLPPSECLHPEIVAQNIRSLRRASADDDLASDPVSVDTKLFAPAFWLDPETVGPRKLAFVREATVDSEVYYQGFVGDWALLKEELLATISGGFPDADLEPIPDDAELDEETTGLKVPYVPAVLRIPPIPGGVTAAAWASVRWQILTSWAAAAGVLVIAGLGVRNLVALTERRMQFAYAVTHELRTPLTTFRLYSDMLSAGLVPETAKQEYLETLNRESVRLSRLVEEILEYARLENQKVRLHVTQTDAPGLLRVVGETLEKVCRQNGIEGRAVNGIPNGQAIRTDVNVVNQIAGVLVNNACRHARSSAAPKVIVELSGESGRLHLDVIDTGPGVDRSDSRRIFKPFRRGKDADRAARGGIGLGLALARNWAALLGGRLDLVARHHPQHKGAHFRLTFPSDGAEA